MKNLAFIFALFILSIGTVGIFVPSVLVWLTQQFVTSAAFYVLAVVRVAFGLVLISVASASRAPKTLRVLGCLIVIAGIMSGLTGLLAVERGRALLAWWLQQGSGVIRLTSAALIPFGGFIAYLCAPGFGRSGDR
jgi:hypothetical protein